MSSIKMLLSILMIVEIVATSIGIMSGMSTKEISYMIIGIYVIWMVLSFISIDICRDNKNERQV